MKTERNGSGCRQIMDAVRFPKQATVCKLYSKIDVERQRGRDKLVIKEAGTD
jgi:hypothetical protein